MGLNIGGRNMGASIGIRNVVSGNSMSPTPPSGRQSVVNLTGNNTQSAAVVTQNISLTPGWYELEMAGCGGGHGNYDGSNSTGKGAPGGYAKFTFLVPFAVTAELSIGTPGANATFNGTGTFISIGGAGGKNTNVLNDTKGNAYYNANNNSNISKPGNPNGGGAGSPRDDGTRYGGGGGGSTPGCGGAGGQSSLLYTSYQAAGGGAGSGGGIGGNGSNTTGSGVPLINGGEGNGAGGGGSTYGADSTTGGGGGGGSTSVKIPALNLLYICGGGGGGCGFRSSNLAHEIPATPGRCNVTSDNLNANNPAGPGYIKISRCV